MQFQQIMTFFLLALAGVEAGLTGVVPDGAPVPSPTITGAPPSRIAPAIRARNPFAKREPVAAPQVVGDI